MFSPGAAADRVADFAANMAEFDPAGFRAMAMASAEADLRDVLPFIDVPTLLLYGDQDVRAPQEVTEALRQPFRDPTGDDAGRRSPQFKRTFLNGR